MLGASLAIKIEEKPFSSIESIADSSQRLIVEDQTLIHGLIINGTSKDLSQLNNAKLHATNYFENPKRAFEKMLNGTWSRSIILGQSDTIEQYTEYPCLINNLDIVPPVQRWLGFVYQKNWPFAKLFDWHLRNIVRDTGLYNKLYHEKIHKRICPSPKVTATHFPQTVVLFTLLGIGFLATSCIFIAEFFMTPLSREIPWEGKEHSTITFQF